MVRSHRLYVAATNISAENYSSLANRALIASTVFVGFWPCRVDRIARYRHDCDEILLAPSGNGIGVTHTYDHGHKLYPVCVCLIHSGLSGPCSVRPDAV